ncbi:hypothetical protein [Jeotgalibacillus sp. R-1-5s-1]|uniref:hypothetical protein n=1 Tax=Jeotgalibacillus sp. R-1-5s-1 TaxID=2555897 RepID=UPI00106C8AD2|nr:hypothetical protein [Jeotgalibacillus sp. R-1-5s-1]TFD95805.1 hypothetical protein E2491_11530 [Jeotgalibacillus sp. R-1-5s-1]
MAVLHELSKLHRSMLLFIRNDAEKAEREIVIERINQFHAERAVLLDQVTPPETDEDRERVNEILQFNELITRFIEQSGAEVKKDIQLHRQKKKQNRQYVDPYSQQRGMDGAFYDTKK